MLIYGVKRYAKELKSYLGALSRLHIVFAAAALLCLVAAGIVFLKAGQYAMARTFFALAVVPPVVLFLWLVRKLCYVKLRPQWAATGGIVYAVAAVSGAFLLARLRWLSPAKALILISCAAAVAAAWILYRLLKTIESPAARINGIDVLKTHWRYGRWASATHALSWMPQHLLYPLLAIWFGRESSAAFKALMIFIMPAAHSYSALTVLLLPAFVKARQQGTFKKFVSVWFMCLSLLMGIYWIILVSIGPWIMNWGFAGKYNNVAGLLWIAGAIPLVASMSSVLCTAMRAMERPDLVLWSYIGSAAATATASVALVMQFSEAGAVIGNALAKAIGLIVIIALLPLAIRTKKDVQPVIE
jgi:O-antigen/teichoic acid export membrane protein